MHQFKLPVKSYKKEYNLLSMHPKLFFGLTRRERQLKQVLMMSLDQLRTSKNIEELRYWLTEWNPKKYPRVRYMDRKEVWRSEEHTSELQSRGHLVCRLLLEKKKITRYTSIKQDT